MASLDDEGEFDPGEYSGEYANGYEGYAGHGDEVSDDALEPFEDSFDNEAFPYSEGNVGGNEEGFAGDAGEGDAELLRATVHMNGTVSTYADERVRRPRLERARAYQELSDLARAVATAELSEAAAQRAEVDAKDRVLRLKEEKETQQALLNRAEAEGAIAANLTEQHVLMRTVASVTEEHRLQAVIMREKVAVARASELATDKLRLSVKRASHTLENLAAAEPEEERSFALATERRVKNERRGAERQVEKVQASQVRARQAEEERRQNAEQQLRSAREGHTRAVTRLRTQIHRNREMVPAIDSLQTERLSARATQVIALKASVDAAASELRSSNARKEERRDRVNKQRDEEKDGILARGGNPYAVFRKIDEDARMARAEKKMKDTLDNNMEQLQTRMLNQNRDEAEKKAAEAEANAMLAAKAKSISAAGKEQKNEVQVKSMGCAGRACG